MFILSRERDLDDVEAFRKYRAYLAELKERFPPRAYSLATAEWYFDFDDHRSPHDAWLEQAILNEVSSGARHETRCVSITLSLLGSYHDLMLQFRCPKVYQYKFSSGFLHHGHQGWRYDEFRLAPNGHLVHEIEWWGPSENSVWIIEADDVEFTHGPYVELARS